MVELWVPYGKTEVSFRVPDENFLGVVEPREKIGVNDPRAEIRRALENPIGAKRLTEIASSDCSVAIVVDDATRPAPSHLMVPLILDELGRVGVKDEKITIIFATGTHKQPSVNDMKRLIGEDVFNKVKAVNHDCNARDLVYMGTTSFGTKVYVNRAFAEADVKILTGDVGMHYYAGYGGGRKSVLPGLSGAETIRHNHAMLLHPNSRTGVLEGNPVHEDMTEAARLAKVDFILNVVMNAKAEIVKAFAGDLERAFLEGVKLVDELYKVPVKTEADIVIVSAGGSPYDIDLYQSYKGVDGALNIVREGGAIILAAECPNGYGNEIFYEWMMNFKNIKEIEAEIKRKFVLGGHKAYYLLKALEKARIYMVSTMPDYYVTNVFKLRAAKTVNAAIELALRATGRDSKIMVLPHGAKTLPVLIKA
jgi:nickel-dependent lactate racemase